MYNQLKEFSRSLKREVKVYRLVAKDERTPWLSRFLIGLAVGYLLLPFDLIPDFIPVIGQLDDLVIVPILIYLGMGLVPEEVVRKARSKAMAN